MTPDQCGTGRPLEQLHPGDRAVVEEFDRYLRGECAVDPNTGQFVPLGTDGAQTIQQQRGEQP